MATWKKVVVSGSDAGFNSVAVGSNQAISTSATTTYLSGSFSGSFSGDGSRLTGVTANFPSTATTALAANDQFFINDGTNKYVTYGNLLTYIAGNGLLEDPATPAGAATSIKVNPDLSIDSLAVANGITATSVTASFQGNLTGTASWADYVVNGSGGVLKVSGSTNGTEITLDTETLKINGTTNQISTNATAETITISLPNDVTIANNLTVSNNLRVNGTTTSVNTVNLTVTDKFILLASSSSPSTTDGGIIVSSNVAGSPATQSGFALYLETSTTPRWAVTSSVSQYATSATPDEYMVTAKAINTNHSANAAAPTWGGSDAGKGNMVVDNSGDIWIYA